MLELFTTREISTAIWIAFLILWILLHRPTRKALVNVLRTACSIQLILPFFLMIAYATGITFLFYKSAFWKPLFIRDIVLWIFFVGTPLFFGAINKQAEEHYFKNIIINNLKLTVLIEFLISTFTLPLIWELILVPVFTFIFMLDTVASIKNQYKPAKKVIASLIIIINVVFIYETVLVAIGAFATLSPSDTLISLFIPIVFSILYIPISYLFSVVSKYQFIFIRMSFKESNGNWKSKLLHRLKTIFMCRLSLSKLNQFSNSCVPYMYVNMPEDKFDELIIQVKLRNLEKSITQHTREEQKIINTLKEDTLHKKIKYINEHIGMFTLLFTITIGFISILIKGFVYVFTCGKFDYWGISHTNINISNENMLYDILLWAASGAIYIALNLIPFTILTSKKPWYLKLLYIFGVIAVTAVIFIGIYLGSEISSNPNYIIASQTTIEIVIISVITTILVYLLGLLMPIAFKDTKGTNQTHSSIWWHKAFSASIIFTFILAIAVYIVMAYNFGKSNAGDQNTFKIIENRYAVIYEGSEHFIISDCIFAEEKKLIIDSTTQRYIKKDNVETSTRAFSKVEKQIK